MATNPPSKILVPTDFSDESLRALQEAVELAAVWGARIELLNVVTMSYWPLFDGKSDVDGELRSAIHADAEGRIRTIQADIIGSRVPSATHVIRGTPHEEIVQFAGKIGADLLVIATHGHSRLKRFMLGSTTESIVRGSPCSVLVLRRRAANSQTRTRVDNYKTILVATDFSECSVQALAGGVEFASSAKAEILLMHVLRDADHPLRQVLAANVWESLHRRCQKWLDQIQMEKIGDKVPSRVLLAEGVPSAKIVDMAAEQKADLIILGSHGRSTVKHAFLGSTAERVARVAPCSVFVDKSRRS